MKISIQSLTDLLVSMCNSEVSHTCLKDRKFVVIIVGGFDAIVQLISRFIMLNGLMSQ